MEHINNRILHVSFNQNGTYFALGTTTGFKIYKSNALELKIDQSTLKITKSRNNWGSWINRNA